MKNRNIILIISAVCIFIIIAGIGIAVITYYYMLNNSSKSENDVQPKIDVQITSFNITGYNNPVGVVWNPHFVLNYTNLGTVDIDNLTVTFTTNSSYQMEREISIFDPISPHYYVAGSTMGQPITLESLTGGETKTFYGEVWNNLDDSSKLRGFAIIAILKCQDVILDQAFVYP